MAILELTLSMSYAGQLAINRFHFVSSGTPSAVTKSFGLMGASGFLTVSGSPLAFPSGTLAQTIRSVQTTGVQYISAYARNLYDPVDFYERPYPVPVYGAQSGVGSSPFMAYGLFSSRVRTDIRRGFKRFVGVREESIKEGGEVEAGMIAALGEICNKLNSPMTYDDEGNTLTYTSCVLSFQEYTTPSGKKAYRPYATESAQLSHLASGVQWAPYTVIRSQTSRQYGRGV